MTAMVRFDPWREMLSLRDAMDQLFEQSFVRPFGQPGSVVGRVPLNVYETEQGYRVQALLPGINPDNIEVIVQENTLTLKGKFNLSFEEGKQVTWLLQEIGSGEFARTLTFEKAIDAEHIETHYEYGMLSIWVPVAASSQPRKISIKAGHNTVSADQPKELAGAR